MELGRKEFLKLSGTAALAAEASRWGLGTFLEAQTTAGIRDVLESATVKKIHKYIADHQVYCRPQGKAHRKDPGTPASAQRIQLEHGD